MQFLYILVILQLWAVGAVDLVYRNKASTNFVSVKDGRFSLDDSIFRFYGTNAYWIQMTTDYDTELTFHDIASAGYNVVRLWAFNDVASKPSDGPYFQVLNSQGSWINEGPDGLQRLDRIVSIANKYGIRLVLTLTNNWNPDRPTPSSAWNRRQNADALPRGYLSNDYGGIDAYIRALHPGGTHDLFYTDGAIIDAFKKYVGHVVRRYANSSTILGWELGNDLRCSSTFPASPQCQTATITNWTAQISSYIKSIDPNHLITAGDGGFYCLNCTKVFAKESTRPSPFLIGSAFDGSYGIDTEDILAVPTIDFGSFQLFPDQFEYFPTTEDTFAIKAIADGGQWVNVHGNTARLLGKPEAVTAAALIDQGSFSSFAPFNSASQVPAGTPCGGVESFQVDYAFTAWVGTALNQAIDGFLEYQWQQTGLTSQGFVNSNWLKRAAPSSPNDGMGKRYQGAASGQNAQQYSAARRPGF